MVNSQIHINPLGNGSSEQQFIDTSFQFHDMSPQELAAFQSIAQQHGQQEHKMVDDEHMMPYVFDVAGAEAHTHRQQGNSQMTQDGNVRAERTVPLAQSVEQQQGQNMNDQGVPTHIQTDSPEEAQVARAVSQSEPNYDEFGISNPSITDANGQPVQTQKLDGKSGTPAWTELKTKAGKERKRLPLACIACRRKKIRCSGEKPACKHCLRSRIPCVYKVTARKAAPRTDYMAMLDKRLRRMEERIIKIVPKNEADVTSVVRAVAKPAIPGTAATKPAAKKRQAEEAFGSELENWAKSTKADSEGIVPASLKAQEQEENRLLVEGADALPTKDIQEHLAEVFFDNLYGQAYHVLHKPSYMRKLK